MVVDEQGTAPEQARPFWPAAWRPLAAAAGLHLAIVVGYSAFFGFNLSCFVNVGYAYKWADAEHFAKGTVKYTNVPGYDGCDYYLVAQDPFVRDPSVASTYKTPGHFMRYQRVAYPAMVHLLAGGERGRFPAAMVAINFLAMAGTTLVLMRLLLRRGASPWLALIFVLGGGMLVSFSLAMQMHLCFFFIVCGLDFYDRDELPLAACGFALALITWESAVLFAAPIGLWELLRRRWKGVVCFALVLAPFLAVQAYFAHRLGARMFSGSSAALDLPFVGLWQALADTVGRGPSQGWTTFARKLLLLPAMALFVAMLGVAVWKLRKQPGNLYNLMVVLQLLFVVIQAKDIWITYSNVMRINAGVFIPLLLSYRDQRERVSPWLFGWAVGLAGLSLVRIFMAVAEPYTLIGMG